jgi:hypothetical protein
MSLLYFRNFKNEMKRNSLISNFEMMELRDLISSLMKGLPKINYYHVILNGTKQLIDLFLDQSFSDLL